MENPETYSWIYLVVIFIVVVVVIVGGITVYNKTTENWRVLTVDDEGDLVYATVPNFTDVTDDSDKLQLNGKLEVTGEVEANQLSIGTGASNFNGATTFTKQLFVRDGLENTNESKTFKWGGVTIQNDVLNSPTVTTNKIIPYSNNTNLTVQSAPKLILSNGIYYVGANPLLNIQLHWSQPWGGYNKDVDHAWNAMSVGVAGTTDAHKQHFQIYKHPVNWAVHSVTWHPEFVERTNVTSNLSFRVVKFSSMSKYRAFMKSDSDYSFLDSGKTDGSSPGIFSYLSSGTSTGKFGITGIAKASISVAKNIDNVPKT